MADKNAAIEKQRARMLNRKEDYGAAFDKAAFEEEMTARTDAFAEKQRVLRETATPPPTDEGGTEGGRLRATRAWPRGEPATTR